MKRKLWKRLRVAGLVLFVAWLAGVGLAYRAMTRGPEGVSAFMSKVPGPLFMVLPFETLWYHARGGTLAVGDAAPDFDLATADGSGRVRLSSFRGKRPVVLVFGSYT